MRVFALPAMRRASQLLTRLPWLALFMASSILVLHSADHEHADWVQRCCVIWTSDHPFSNLLRMPGSVVSSAPGLPCWGAVLQVLIVVGLAEIWCGWRQVLLTGLLAHVIATLVGSAVLHLQLHHGQMIEHIRDTGPSVFVLAVGWLAACTKQKRWLRSLAAGLTALVVVSSTQLVAIEHLTGAVCGSAVGSWLVWSKTRGAQTQPLRARALRWLQGLRLRHVGIVLAALALLGVTWHDYEPLTVNTASTTSTTGPVVEVGVRDLALLPVHVAPPRPIERTRPVQAAGWWSTQRSCRRTHLSRAHWVWRRRLWWCEPATSTAKAPATIHYSVAGIHETTRVQVT